MYDIVAKIKAIGLPQENYQYIPKFYAALSDDLITLEDLTTKINYLNEKGIMISKPSQIKVLSNSFEFIKSQVETAETKGCLDMLIADPSRINSRQLFKRIDYLAQLGEPLKNENGKYNKIIFDKKEFDRKYGVGYLNIKMENPLNIKEDKIIDNNIEKNIISPNSVSNIEEGAISSNVEDLNSEANKEINVPIVEPVEVNSYEPSFIVEDIKPEEPVKEESSQIIQEVPVVEQMIEAEEDNPYIMALSKDQTIRLDDEMLAKYEDMTGHLKHVLESLNYGSEIDETKANNLIKLLTSGITDAREILYYTITYNKNLTDEEKVNIYKAIDEELKLDDVVEKTL